jgi:hypothetical protein
LSNGEEVIDAEVVEDADEFDAARVIAETLRAQAARMPIDSPLRALALRSATRWGRVAGTSSRLEVVR